MKSTLLFSILFVFFLSPLFLSAQVDETPKNEARVIHVQGSASREIIPNEYYFQVVVTEFMQSKVKTNIETIERRLLKGLDSIGIELNQISLDRMRDLQTFQKRKNREHMTTQLYQIKLTDLTKLKPMLEVLSQAPVQEVTLNRVNHSDMVQFRKEVKIDAIKAGKAKVDYLLEAVGNKTGKLLLVEEVESSLGVTNFYMNENSISNSNYRSFASNDNANSITFKTIKIRFAFDLKFEIID